MISPIFVAHGSPTIVIEDNEYTRTLKEFGKSLKPKAIVVFTAHFEEETTTISAIDDTYNMIYDFYGFPRELYEMRYPAKGSVKIALKLQDMFNKKNIKSKLNTKRGLDHGAWTILKLMFPEANIPVVQVSVNQGLAIEEQFKIGEAIQELGNEDILVVGSGSTVHNLSELKWEAEKPEKWPVEFDDWLIDKVKSRDEKSLFQYRKLAPHAKLAVPRQEHLIPLFIAMGSSKNEELPKVLSRIYEYGTLSYICLQF
ncbi:DODA-type extradiol aromatic ring-opening family dioxygenase [Clostridium hydrogenum]|uniref:DODA-type extradiol aromatic ring-opening family dioxygenase n=1 Tax=Clostridium hydrogenum TaxID=2855764 RepID=UPI001F2D360C|nr:class III extradiol ring-cleavage dioxygenase [Clostridium hydrogenum]